jgi:CheY-like chemotaxis protein
MNSERLLILLAEDDDGHASLIRRNLKRAGVINDVVRVRDGQEALDYLKEIRHRTDEGNSIPLLILLDINMPRVSGLEVLRDVKSDPRTSVIPVIMLTTTDDPREVHRCYESGCSVYLTKPVQYEQFVEAIKRLGLFLEIIKAPTAKVGQVSPE